MADKTIKKQVEEAHKEILRGIKKDFLLLGKNLAVIAKDETKAEIVRQKGYASRNMLNKTNAQVKNTKDGVVVELGTNAISEDNYEYPRVYELGRRAGKGVSKKGQEAIVKWINVKIRLGHFKPIRLPVRTKRTRLSDAKRKENIIKGIAFIISQNIKKNGQKGHFVFKHGFQKMLDSFIPELNRIIGGLEF